MRVQLDQASHVQLSHFTHHPQFLLWLPRDLDLAVAGEQLNLFLPAQLVSGWGIPRAGGWWGKTS